LGSRYSRGDYLGGDTGLQAVEVFRQLAFALGQRRSGAGDRRILSVPQGILHDDLGCRGLYAIR
jgi:hypothetical protein